MWHIKGDCRGPTVVVLGGTHGSELTGIAVVQSIAQMLGLLDQPFGKTYGTKHPASGLVRGNLFLGFGNPEAILRCTRSASTGPDLNRSFLPKELAAAPQNNDRADLKRARRLCSLLSKANFLLDIHSTSTESIPFLCSATEGLAHRAVVGLLPTPWFLSDPDMILGKDLEQKDFSTTDSWVNRHGGVGLCYETGRDDRQEDTLRVLPAVVMTLTHKFGALVPHKHQVQTRFSAIPLEVDTSFTPPDQSKHFYKLTHCEIATEQAFTYAPEFSGGWVPTKANQVIGIYGSGQQVLAPHDGMVILQRHPNRIVVGQHFYYLAVPV